MNLNCPKCKERIVARSFGKCPACFTKLPDELQLTEFEKEKAKLYFTNPSNPSYAPTGNISVSVADCGSFDFGSGC